MSVLLIMSTKVFRTTAEVFRYKVPSELFSKEHYSEYWASYVLIRN